MQEPIDIYKIYDILPAQLGFLVESEAGKNNFYKQQITVRVVDKTVGVQYLVENILKIYHNSEILRTIFDLSTDKPLQIILTGIEPVISVESCDQNKLKLLLEQELNKLNKVTDLPPIRFLISILDDGIYLTITYNHILLDGPSIYLLLSSIISGKIDIIENQIVNYLDWYDLNVKKKDMDNWKKKLSELPSEDIDIFGDFQEAHFSQTSTVLIDGVLAENIIETAAVFRVTPSSLMHAMWQQWAKLFFSKSNLVYGLVTSTRIPGVNDSCLGVFINTIPWFARDDNYTLKDSAKEIQSELLELQEEKHIPLNQISKLAPSKVLFFDILLTIAVQTDSVYDGEIFEIVNTHENIGYPLSVDITIGRHSIEIMFSSILSSRDFNLHCAIGSFADYIKEQIGLKNLVNTMDVFKPVKSGVMNINKMPISEMLKNISKVLNVDVDTLDASKSFILNGGDSILSLQLKSILNENGYDVSIGKIIKIDRIIDLVKCVTKMTDAVDESRTELGIPSRISDIIEAYNLGFESDFHEQAAFKILGNLDLSAFHSAIVELGENISSLRIQYDMNYPYGYYVAKSGRVEYIHNKAWPVNFADFTKYISEKDLFVKFDPSKGPLLRIYTQSDKKGTNWYLFMSFSSLVTDGWSFSNLLETLMIFYTNYKEYKLIKTVDDRYIECLQKMYDTPSLMRSVNAIDSGAGKIYEHTYRFLKQETINITNTIRQSGLTPSAYFEKAIKEISSKLDIASMYIYENGRDLHNVNSKDVIGAFCYLRKNAICDRSSESIYYVYENYPKESESRLRRDFYADFREVANWRRPLLPPTINTGVLIDIIDGEYVVNILIRNHNKPEEKSLNIFKSLRNEVL